MRVAHCTRSLSAARTNDVANPDPPGGLILSYRIATNLPACVNHRAMEGHAPTILLSLSRGVSEMDINSTAAVGLLSVIWYQVLLLLI